MATRTNREGPAGLSLAYVAGMILAPFLLLFVLALVNEGGERQCRERDDITFSGKRVVVRQCVGTLGLTTGEPQIVAYID